MNSKKWVVAAVAGSCLIFNIPAAMAAFPDHAVHIIVGFAPGAGVDTVTRFIGQKLSDKWGQPVIVENREGANGIVAAEVVARSAPDGYTLMGASSAFMVPPGGDIKTNYDPIKSFSPVTLVATNPNILLVNPSLPVNSVKELIELAKSKPGQLNFGSPGTNSPAFMQMAQLMNQTGTKMVNVSYKGAAPAVLGLIGGEVQLGFASVTAASTQVKAGKLKALAVTTNVRVPSMPDIPTIAESLNLPDYNEGIWDGFFGPAGVPSNIVQKLHDDIVAVVKLPDVQQRLLAQGYVTIAGSPKEFADFLAKDFAKTTALQKSLLAR